MSWHYSLALVEEFSALDCLDGESCAQLKSARLTERSYFDARRKGTSEPSLFGMTSEPSTVAHGLEKWMSSLAETPARRTAEQAAAIAGLSRLAATSFELSMKFARDSSSAKTLHRRIRMRHGRRTVLLKGLNHWVIPRSLSLSGRVVWALSTKESAHSCSASIATPLASQMHKRIRPLCPAERRRHGKRHGIQTIAHWGNRFPVLVGRYLTPTYVERLMGWPIGWTALEPLETAKFRQWLEQHGNY